MRKTITVNQLHKMLGKLIASGQGRVPIVIDKPTFTHNLESEGCVLLMPSGIVLKSCPMSDGNGGIEENKDGSESCRTMAILYGASATAESAGTGKEPHELAVEAEAKP
jgi:hypothetical protein